MNKNMIKNEKQNTKTIQLKDMYRLRFHRAGH